MNKWVSTAHDLFGTDNSSSAEWAYVWGIKGRWDERKKIEEDIEVNKGKLNEESRGHYHDEIVGEVELINRLLSDDQSPFYVADEKFHREIGTYAGKKYTVEGEEWDENDGSYEEYCKKLLPSEKDEETLKELFKQEWIEFRAPTKMMIESGIGQLK